ncbi:hypothetical protein HHI36_017178 [Cryptolaemus montrouzieri]|uniref:RNA polymerase II elongation factor ELL N-terminal domain-containing protein n=1 Tax=Cryptolaemus montrouzieri TaxID=559131 RepID=A0ABD2NMJ4_9CUCU
MSSTQDMEGPGGSFECLRQTGPPRGPLGVLGSIPYKIRVHANDDVYAATRQRMTVAEENHKNKCWVSRIPKWTYYNDWTISNLVVDGWGKVFRSKDVDSVYNIFVTSLVQTSKPVCPIESFNLKPPTKFMDYGRCKRIMLEKTKTSMEENEVLLVRHITYRSILKKVINVPNLLWNRKFIANSENETEAS